MSIKQPYQKKPLNYQQQLLQLQERGLQVNNPEKVLHLLQNISYYRLSGYWYPLLKNKKDHLFKENATFELAFSLYCFDRELRQLVLSETEKIEVAIRAKMSYVLSFADDAFWFEQPKNFSDPIKHANSLTKIGDEYKRSDEEFIQSFRKKYSNAIPPSWMTLEITSFGTLSLLYKNLKPTIYKKEIANYFGLSESVFETWMHSLVYLRNVCAHHTRLWNRAMSIQPKIPHTPKKQWLINTEIANNRTYFILSMVSYLLQTINPKNQFSIKFKSLLLKYSNVDTKALGFPDNWQQEPLWQ